MAAGSAKSVAARVDHRGEVAERRERMEAAARKTQSGCLRAAVQLLTGEGKAPPSRDTLDRVRELLASHVTEEQAEETAAACAEARKAVREVPLIQLRAVRRKVRALKRAAEPGPSAWRNSHLVMIAERPGGVDCLARWCRLWAAGSFTAGSFTQCENMLWASVVIAPISRDSGAKLRPIALGEALTKLAQACLVDQVAGSLRLLMEPRQLSVRTPGGAELLARMLRSWLAQDDGTVLLQLDLRNAYGRMLRGPALQAVLRSCPALAPQLAAQWELGTTKAYVWCEGQCERVDVERGAWQGGPDSNPTFCLSLEEAFQDTDLAADLGCARVGYADDTFVSASARTLAAHWSGMINRLAASGFEAQPTKCGWLRAGGTEAVGADADGETLLSRFIPRREGAALIMGTEAGCEYATYLEEGEGTSAAAARERCQQAQRLCDAVVHLGKADLRLPTLAPAWTLLTKCAARALDYDARLVPVRTLSAVTRDLDASLACAAEQLVGADLTEKALAQVQLPGSLGGCGLRLPSTMVAPGLWASWCTHNQAMQQFSNDLGRCGVHAAAAAAAEEAAAELCSLGIKVQEGGNVSLDEAAAERVRAGPWEPREGVVLRSAVSPPACQRLLGRILERVELLAATAVWEAGDKHARERLLSAGGRGTGSTWECVAGSRRPDAAEPTLACGDSSAPWVAQHSSGQTLRVAPC